MVINKFFKFSLILATITATAVCYEEPAWGFECDNGKCIKLPFKNEYSSQSLSVCRMLCGEEIGTLWPKPTGSVKKGKYVTSIDPKNIRFQVSPKPVGNSLWDKVESRFQDQIDAKVPASGVKTKDGLLLVIRIYLGGTLDKVPKFTYETDESYTLEITEANKQVSADISANTFFGARHGLESLSQLIVFDDITGCVQILTNTEINDSPVYKHRGLLLDTGRHYFSVKSIKRTIDGMALSKLNTFHWHIVDTNSFPLVVKSRRNLHRLGAYSPQKIYTPEDIREIVAYAIVRGIRVIPEFGGPAHTGEGWQKENVTVCFKAQPWKYYCNQPPCGQLDPTIDEVYNLLEDIYTEVFQSFEPNIFHMGGDTVSISCWNSSKTIQDWMRNKGWSLTERDFVKLWGHFHINSLAKVDKVSEVNEVPIILWDGYLTTAPFIDEYLTSKSRYIVQTVWTGCEKNTRDILDRGFRMITTNVDLFINGDTARWTGGGNIGGWQKFYDNRPDRVLGRQSDLILGSEAAVWSEQIDEFSLDTLLWPKASAMAERLWSNPETNWKEAEPRLLSHRELLSQNGIGAEAIQPEWCFQNQDECHRDT